MAANFRKDKSVGEKNNILTVRKYFEEEKKLIHEAIRAGMTFNYVQI